MPQTGKIAAPLGKSVSKLHSRGQKTGRQNATQSQKTLPLKHVAIIMDGNRRWADRQGMPRLVGHRQGVQSLKRLVKHVVQQGLQYLTVYAFSSENWQRGQEEVDYLMELFREVLKGELSELAAAGCRLRFIGDIEGMPADLKAALQKAEADTASNNKLNLQVALNYGSRAEMVHAIKRLLADSKKGVIDESAINEELIAGYLYTAGIPDPDLMIRTGGEMRLSNYLLFQAAYTELYVTAKMWPEFTPDDFDKAVVEFESRQRRYGGD